MPQAIDFSHLDRSCFGDAGLRREVLALFVEQAERCLGELEPAAPDEMWKRAAHTLKGASRGVGAFAVGDLCELMEHLCGPMQRKAEARAGALVDLAAEILRATAEARLLSER